MDGDKYFREDKWNVEDEAEFFRQSVRFRLTQRPSHWATAERNGVVLQSDREVSNNYIGLLIVAATTHTALFAILGEMGKI